MKKLILMISSLLFVATVSAKAEVGIGIAGGLHNIKSDGVEITRQSGERNAKSLSETTAVPEVFVEKILDDGSVVGISYIPTREVSGTRSRSDSNSE